MYCNHLLPEPYNISPVSLSLSIVCLEVSYALTVERSVWVYNRVKQGALVTDSQVLVDTSS